MSFGDVFIPNISFSLSHCLFFSPAGESRQWKGEIHNNPPVLTGDKLLTWFERLCVVEGEEVTTSYCYFWRCFIAAAGCGHVCGDVLRIAPSKF